MNTLTNYQLNLKEKKRNDSLFPPLTSHPWPRRRDVSRPRSLDLDLPARALEAAVPDLGGAREGSARDQLLRLCVMMMMMMTINVNSRDLLNISSWLSPPHLVTKAAFYSHYDVAAFPSICLATSLLTTSSIFLLALRGCSICFMWSSPYFLLSIIFVYVRVFRFIFFFALGMRAFKISL